MRPFHPFGESLTRSRRIVRDCSAITFALLFILNTFVLTVNAQPRRGMRTANTASVLQPNRSPLITFRILL